MHEVGNETSYRERFLREARAAAQIQSPHVARVFDVDEWQGRPYIAMEFLEGETLDARLERVGALSPELTCEIIDQMARGLARAHAARLIHRDLKPANVFLVRQEPGEPLLVKLLDFGLAKRLDRVGTHATQSGMLLGTPGYMSPEQALASKAVDERTDLWSLAAITYHCLTGTEPFPGTAIAQVLMQVIHGELPVPSQVNPTLAPAFDSWWRRAAHRNAAERPSSALLLATELRKALGLSLPPSPGTEQRAALALNDTALANSLPAEPRPDTLEPASRSRPKHRDGLPVGIIVAALASAIVAGGLILGLRHRGTAPDDVEATVADPISMGQAGAEPSTVPKPSAVPEPSSVPEAPIAAEVSPPPAVAPPAPPRAAEAEGARVSKPREQDTPKEPPSAKTKPAPTHVSRANPRRHSPHEVTPRQPTAPEAPAEKKHDRLGF
jgi:serine/threonine-protein kinase